MSDSLPDGVLPVCSLVGNRILKKFLEVALYKVSSHYMAFSALSFPILSEQDTVVFFSQETFSTFPDFLIFHLTYCHPVLLLANRV